MHIPDGFLSPPVWASLGLVSVPAVGWMARQAQQRLDESRTPLLGVLGAFVFAAQMINFPVAPGVSAHLVGGTLLAVTLGPAAATIVMTAILMIQALIFQDGGILALGANVFNMGILGVLTGYLPYHYLGHNWRRAAILLGGALSVLTGACLAFSQLVFSGITIPPALVGISLAGFLVTAAFEGFITLAILEAIERLNPAWIRSPEPSRNAAGILAAAAVMLALGGVVFASSWPDLVESFSARLGIASREVTLLSSPLSGYEWQGLATPWLRKAAAGFAGLTAVWLVLRFFTRLIAAKEPARASHGD
jgi:cobalt/nickel transport system permease protein